MAALRDPFHALKITYTDFSGEKDPEAKPNLFWKTANAFKENWRGLIGTIPLLFLLLLLTELKTRPDNTVKVIWIAMFWLLLLQPVNVPVTGLVPVFAFPCLHVLSSDEVCSRFFNSTMVLFIVGGYLLMLLNNSSFDKRVILWLLSPPNVALTTYRLLIRSSFAAFILSMFSNRLMVTSRLMEYINEPLMDLQNTATERGSKADYMSFRYIMSNAIATSSSIGSIAILNASYAALAMRSIWESHGTSPDVFNFLQFSVFTLPVSFVMFGINLLYHIALLMLVMKIPMSSSSLENLGNNFVMNKEKIPPNITLHETGKFFTFMSTMSVCNISILYGEFCNTLYSGPLSIIFLVLNLVLYYLRWSEILRQLGSAMGWAHYGQLDIFNNPRIADATVSCIFAIILHIIPNCFNFAKYFKRKLKKGELPSPKAETGILNWRFVDKNTNYGYILLIGGGVALNAAVISSGLATQLQDNSGFITNQNWNIGIGLVCLLSVVLCNIMTSAAVVVIILPFIINMAPPHSEWEDKLHICTLVIGVACSFGYALPFRYTPAYYVKIVGNVPLLQQVKYAVGSIIICFVVLWISVCLFANSVFVGDTRFRNPMNSTSKYF